MENKNSYANEIIRKHWKVTAVFTAYWNSENEKELLESELWPGEITAYVSTVGCYIVRRSIRVYNIYEPGYFPEKETPASQADVDMVKNDIESGTWYEWRDRLRLTHEISARHCDNLNGSFTYICRAAEARNYNWSESIGNICTAKKHPFILDKYASLFVCNTCMGDSYSSETWYKLSCTGKIKILRLHPYGDDESAGFERINDTQENEV